MVHGSLKSTNVLLDRENSVKIADVGVRALEGQHQEQATETALYDYASATGTVSLPVVYRCEHLNTSGAFTSPVVESVIMNC